MPPTFFNKGILLAGGTGSRLQPVTLQVSKQLLPVYDKPMVYYPLSTLMIAGIRDILLICTPRDRPAFEQLFQDGSQLGISIRYAEQTEPNGIAASVSIGKTFLNRDHFALILGDNIFYGQGLRPKLELATQRREGATVYCYAVQNPEDYGVVQFDSNGKVRSLAEKPDRPRSHQAITGLYFYDEKAIDFANDLQPSSRGEYEITDLNRRYLEEGLLHVESFGRGFAWLDTGNEVSLLQAANFVETVQQRQGLRIACVEEVAYRLGYISLDQLARLAHPIHSSYGQYLRDIVDQEQ